MPGPGCLTSATTTETRAQPAVCVGGWWGGPQGWREARREQQKGHPGSWAWDRESTGNQAQCGSTTTGHIQAPGPGTEKVRSRQLGVIPWVGSGEQKI